MSMTFMSKSVSGLDVFDDVAHGLAQVLVILHVPFHGLEGVDDGGVVAAGKFPPVCRNVKYRSMILRAIFQLRKCGKKDIIRMHIEKLHRKP